MQNIERIGKIRNFYGELRTATDNGRFYWIIENYDTDLSNVSEWHEISEELYKALKKHKEGLLSAAKGVETLTCPNCGSSDIYKYSEADREIVKTIGHCQECFETVEP